MYNMYGKTQVSRELAPPGQSSGNCIDVNSFSIVGKEAHGITRTIKETSS